MFCGVEYIFSKCLTKYFIYGISISMQTEMDIKKLRENLGGITQEELARRLKVSVVTVQKWEQGKNKPSRLARRQIERLERSNQYDKKTQS